LEADLKSREHSKSLVSSEVITADRIRAFCEALGAECPSLDADCVAPPTFLTCFRHGELELFDLIGLKLQNVLHGEQLYEFESDIRAGDEITFQTELTHVLDKKGGSGRLCFLSLETLVTSNSNGETRKIGKSKTTVVVREKGAA
jgi:N-terminal half of MaoC dehydratase